MDISEKLIDSCNKISLMIAFFLIAISVLSLYLLQRTIDFIDFAINSEKLDHIARTAQQSAINLGMIELKFYFWFLDFAWVWILVGILMIVRLLFIKRNNINIALKKSMGDVSPQFLSAMLPFDFLDDNGIKSSLLLLLIPPLLVINNCLFIIIQLVPLYFDEGWYFHSLSNLSGSLLSLLLVISIVLEVKKGLIRDK